MRSRISSTGAHTPIDAWVGNRPISTVTVPIITKVITSDFLRPILSPIWPKMAPPKGRAKKPTANVPKAASVP
ncbi:hypothetical protein D3C71_1127100 [compost metagenome]